MGALDYINDGVQEYPKLLNDMLASNSLQHSDDHDEDMSPLKKKNATTTTGLNKSNPYFQSTTQTTISNVKGKTVRRKVIEDEEKKEDEAVDVTSEHLKYDQSDEDDDGEDSQSASSNSTPQDEEDDEDYYEVSRKKTSPPSHGSTHGGTRRSQTSSLNHSHHGEGNSHQQQQQDNQLQVCACCHRDARTVSFLKNYSIHQGNIFNYKNCFPEYNVSYGISCMTCYHKQWRYTKGLYDPNKARNTSSNKREGIQYTGSASTTNSTANKNTGSTRKKRQPSSSSNKRKKEDESNNQVSTTKPRKISKHNKNPSPSTTMMMEETSNKIQSSDPESTEDILTDKASSGDHHNWPSTSTTSTTSTSESIPALRETSLRLVLKYALSGSPHNMEVFSCVVYPDFIPTTLTSLTSLVMSKLKAKVSEYSFDYVVCASSMENRLTDKDLQNKAVKQDDTLIVFVK